LKRTSIDLIPNFTKEKEMADFRKLVLALAVLALIAVPASAQTTFQCNTGGTVPTIVRAEGITEQVGDTLMACSGVLPTDIVTNVQIFLNTNVTNRFGTSTDIPQLIVDNGAPISGSLVGNNSVLWTNVAIGANAAGSTRAIRITGLRANATQAPPASSGIPGQIIEFISITGPTSVPVFPANAPVAYVLDGVSFSVGNESVHTFQQCVDGTRTFSLNFKENIINAFKTLAEEGAGASNGTRLFVRFSGVPTGAAITVSTTQTNATGPTAVLVGSDPAAGGAIPTTAPSGKVTLTGGTGTAVWEITGDNPTGALETLTFDATVTVPAGISFTGTTTPTATVVGGFAPISTVHTSSTTAPIVRFIEQTESGNLFNVTACVTNLLFPYVTNQANFDTGVALVNTSLDTGVFDSSPQNGTCTVYYFGTMGNGAQVPGPQTTATVNAGEMVTFLLSSGGVAGATQSAATFQGYLIARCNFQYGHGFAFISGVGLGQVAHGYLALVIPDSTANGGGRAPSPFTVNGAGSGEQLGF
jgi:hypothetical protein